jgi:predicted GIY-YIG superfamily endonuclease
MIKGFKMYLYKISFPKNLTTKCYIGITSQSLKRRLNGHCKLSNDSLISRAIRRYGEENIIVSIVSECNNWELLCLAEMEAIEKFNRLDAS